MAMSNDKNTCKHGVSFDDPCTDCGSCEHGIVGRGCPDCDTSECTAAGDEGPDDTHGSETRGARWLGDDSDPYAQLVTACRNVVNSLPYLAPEVVVDRALPYIVEVDAAIQACGYRPKCPKCLPESVD